MKRIVRVIFWILGVSACLGLAVGFPYFIRDAMAQDGWQWWWFSVVVIGGVAIIFGFFLLHAWAFGIEERE